MHSASPQSITATNPGAVLPLAALRRAMAAALPLVDKRNHIPVLSNVRILGNGKRVFLTVTDGGMGMEFSQAIDAWSDPRLRMTVPAGILSDMCRNAPNVDTVALEAPMSRAWCDMDTRQLREELEGRARIRFGERTESQIESISALDFPAMNRDSLRSESARHFSMSGIDFLDGIESVRFAISTEETRYYLNGIFLHETAGGNLAFCATDGHRLSLREMPLPDGAAGMSGVILPRKACGFLAKALKGKACPATVDISISPTMVRVRWGDSVLLSKAIDGTFPDYPRVVPDRVDKPLVVDTAELNAAIKSVSPERGRAVKLSLSAGKIGLAMSSPDMGESSAEVSCAYDADPLEIGFNSDYLADVLATVQNGRKGVPATMHFRDPGDPVRIDGRNGCTMVLMPMRV